MIPGSLDLFLKTGPHQRADLVTVLRNKSKLPGVMEKQFAPFWSLATIPNIRYLPTSLAREVSTGTCPKYLSANKMVSQMIKTKAVGRG